MAQPLGLAAVVLHRKALPSRDKSARVRHVADFAGISRLVRGPVRNGRWSTNPGNISDSGHYFPFAPYTGNATDTDLPSLNCSDTGTLCFGRNSADG